MAGRFSVQLPGPATPEGGVWFFEAPRGYIADPATNTFVDANRELTSRVKAMEPGDFLLARKEFKDIAERGVVGQFVEAIDEDADNKMAYTRERNSHGVLFGQLIMRSVFDKEKNSFVALKPFDFPKEAIHEFGVTEFVNGFGKPRRPLYAMNPFGFYRFENGQTGLLTEYEEPVISYDTLFWDPDTEPTPQQVQKAMGHVALALGTLHLMRLSHGDAQVKNFAADNKGIRLIDLESAQGFPFKDGTFNEQLIRNRIAEDIDTFVNSLNAGIEDTSRYRDYSGQIGSIFAPKYVRTINVHGSRVPESARMSVCDITKLVA